MPKRTFQVRPILRAAVLLLLLGFPAAGAAVDESPPFVVLEVMLQGEKPIKIGLQQGGLATFESLRQRVRVGFRLVGVDLESSTAEVEIVSLQGRSGEYRVGTLLEKTQLDLGRAGISSAAGLPMELHVRKLSRSSTRTHSSPVEAQFPEAICGAFTPENQGTGCCLTCDGIKACGCYVGGTCGSCCDCPSCQ